MTPLPGIPGIPGNPGNLGNLGACSKKLALEQHSFTFADFCSPLTHLLGISWIPRACFKKLVFEQHCFTFEETTEGSGRTPPPSVVAAEGRHLRLGTEQSTYPSSQHSLSCVSTRQMSWLASRHTSYVSTLRHDQCSQPTQRTKGGGLRPPPHLWCALCWL